MKIQNIITYQIPSFFLSALINGDYSGLTDSEVTNLEAFEARCVSNIFETYPNAITYHWSYDSETNSSFTHYHDMDDTIKACDCSEIQLVILIDNIA